MSFCNVIYLQCHYVILIMSALQSALLGGVDRDAAQLEHRVRRRVARPCAVRRLRSSSMPLAAAAAHAAAALAAAAHAAAAQAAAAFDAAAAFAAAARRPLSLARSPLR